MGEGLQNFGSHPQLEVFGKWSTRQTNPWPGYPWLPHFLGTCLTGDQWWCCDRGWSFQGEAMRCQGLVSSSILLSSCSGAAWRFGDGQPFHLEMARSVVGTPCLKIFLYVAKLVGEA